MPHRKWHKYTSSKWRGNEILLYSSFLLILLDKGGTFLTAAAECGNHFILPLLYSIGIDVNHRDNVR